jgi:antitoxin component YwqK of YwqJK toxin-antitoxin module
MKTIKKYYYKNGNLASEFIIFEGFDNGTAKNYYKNGNRYAIFQKKKNIDHGIYINFSYNKKSLYAKQRN